MYREENQSQADPDKQILPNKECDCGFMYTVCKKKRVEVKLQNAIG